MIAFQWATDPVWRHLPDAGVRGRLLAQDGSFLLEQLAHEPVRLLLLNGRTVIDQFARLAGIQLTDARQLDGPGSHSTRLLVGQLPGPVRIVGWSTNLQSSFGVTRQLRAKLARQASELARTGT